MFDIINIASYNIVLRILWLKKHNSQINWKQKIFIMKYKYVLDSESHHQLNTIKNKRTSWRTQPKNVTIFNPKIEHSNKRSTIININ